MGKVVAAAACWRAELTVGTRHGYAGPEVVTPDTVIKLVEDFQYSRKDREWFAVIVWTRGTVIGPTFPKETVIKLTLENNPMYTADARYDDVEGYAIDLAAYLAEQLHQIRVYIAVYRIDSLIFDTTA